MPASLARRFSRRLEEASAIVRESSTCLEVRCIDFWRMPEALDAKCYSVDGVHPNSLGYLRVAERIAEALCDDLKLSFQPQALKLRGEVTTV